MKKITLAFAFSMAALVGCSSEATPVDTATLDQQTQTDALQTRANEFVSQLPTDRDGKPIVPADWTKFDPSLQSMAEVAANVAAERANNKIDIAVPTADHEVERDSKEPTGPINAMRSSCYDTVSYESCCYYFSGGGQSCCVFFAGGYGYCHG
jgi:hypothetical protein